MAKCKLRLNSLKFLWNFLALTSDTHLGKEKYTVSFKVFMRDLSFIFVAKIADAVNRILDFVSDKPVSVHQIVCKTKLHTNTVNSYLELIEKIQNSRKIKKVVKKSRVFFMWE